MEHKHTFELPMEQIREALDKIAETAFMLGMVGGALMAAGTTGKVTVIIIRRLFR